MPGECWLNRRLRTLSNMAEILFWPFICHVSRTFALVMLLRSRAGVPSRFVLLSTPASMTLRRWVEKNHSLSRTIGPPMYPLMS